MSGSTSWTPVTNWGWAEDTDAATGVYSYQVITASFCTFGYTRHPYTVYGNYIYQDNWGVVHAFGNTKNQHLSCLYTWDKLYRYWICYRLLRYTLNAVAIGIGSTTVTSSSGQIITAPPVLGGLERGSEWKHNFREQQQPDYRHHRKRSAHDGWHRAEPNNLYIHRYI